MLEEDIRKLQHPEGLSETQERLSLQLFDIGAIKFGDVRLKLHDKNPDAPLSPVYFDLRMLRRIPQAKTSAVDAYQELVRPLYFDLIADIPTAATPLVSSLADRLGVGMITPRSEEKTHGIGEKIDGFQKTDRGKTAVLIDDLVTKADSKFNAIQTLTSQGIIVNDIVVLIDREQGGRQQLEEKGFRLHSSFKMSEMLNYYLRIGKISQDQYQDISQRLETLNKFINTR